MGSILYNIIVYPIEMLVESVFCLIWYITQNIGISIIGISIVINILILPMYNRADKIQAEERDKFNRMKPWVNHINKTFKGDERYMITMAYYKKNNYHPLSSLKSSISLLLQIPFFIAAYHFLSV